MLGQLSRAQSRAVGELGLLEIEDGDLAEALGLLQAAARRFPGSARVRYALARAEREAAARRGRPDPAAPEAPALPWRRLARLDERFRPLQLLGEGRTWLVQVDGTLVEDKGRECIGHLGLWIKDVQERHAARARASEKEEGSAGFSNWWADEVQTHLFGGQAVFRYEDLPDLDPFRELAARNAVLLDRIEEDWLGHWARA